MSAQREFSATLDNLPPGTSIPAELQAKLRYDSVKKVLVVVGSLTSAEREKLRSLSADAGFWNAVESLYEKSQDPPDHLELKEADDTKYVTEEISAMKRYVHRLLGLWFIVIGGTAIFFLICLWPSSVEIQADAGVGNDAAAQVETLSVSADTTKTAISTDSLHRTGIKIIKKIKEKAFPSTEQRFLLISLLAGMLGGAAGGFSSLLDFRGNRRLFTSWTLWYFGQPLLAGMIAVIFYVCIRAGFFSSASGLQNVNVFGITAFCAMVGLFTDDATTKLAEVFKTLFASSKNESRDGQLNASKDKKDEGAAQ